MRKYLLVLGTVYFCVIKSAEEIVFTDIVLYNSFKCTNMSSSRHRFWKSAKRSVLSLGEILVTWTEAVVCQDQGQLVVLPVRAKINWFGCRGGGGQWPSRPVVDSWFTSSTKSVATPHHTAQLTHMWVLVLLLLFVYNIQVRCYASFALCCAWI